MSIENSLFYSLSSNDNQSNLIYNNDPILQEAPKLENNDLLLEILDSHLMDNNAQLNDAATIPNSPPYIADADVFDSIFKNSNDPLLEPVVNQVELDDDLKQMFDFAHNDSTLSSVPVEKQFDAIDQAIFDSFNPELEPRAKSAIPITSTTISTSSTVSCKRSYSTADLSPSPDSGNTKDKLGCTPYTRKQRSNPLPPVVPKGEDIQSMKRARNTEAARRSRARKMERMTQLEDKCEILLKENNDLKSQIENLKKLLADR